MGLVIATREQIVVALVDRIDRLGYPAATAGPRARARVIAEEVGPLAAALHGVELGQGDLALLAWLIMSGEGQGFARIIAAARRAPALTA